LSGFAGAGGATGSGGIEVRRARGRSDQRFLVDVVVRSGDTRRRAVARGRYIYAISAPLAVEAVVRPLT
jgi:hypothetical protein